MTNRLIIILPTYNEATNIKAILQKIYQEMPQVSVLVVDDNSPDGTSKIVQALQVDHPSLELYLRVKKEGLGKAYIDAFKRVLAKDQFDWMIMMDADGSHDPCYLKEMVDYTENFDCLIGSRYVLNGQTVGWELWRRILSRFGNWYCRAVTGMPINDCTGGFNMMRVDTIRKLNFNKIDLSGYAFIMELKYSLFKVGARFKEIPIIFHNRRGGESKLSNHIIGEGILAPWKMILRNK